MVINGVVVGKSGISDNVYTGKYTVMPILNQKTILKTNGKFTEYNIVVPPISYKEEPNESGTTAIIGG